ncbi:MAG: hypothetical protein HYR97_05275 [Candidatus Melainabacteria bacterium]|nr:hypothetical protein [Candidatus Melainabacteria bacterium]
MYRLVGPNLLIFIPIIAIGIIVATIIPSYMGANRILSFSSLIIGEIGMSFIPVLAFFPKATLLQIITLALIYLLNTLVICIAAWGVYSLGFTNAFALIWKDNSFQINTYALFAANIFSLINMVLCFKLIYDEELAKEFHSKKKSLRSETKFGIRGFKSPLLKRPDLGSGSAFPPPPVTDKPSTGSGIPSKKKDDFLFDEEIEKPFQFEPDITEPLDDLPLESKGDLFYKDDDKDQEESSEFFDDEKTEHQARKTSDTFPSKKPGLPNQPSLEQKTTQTMQQTHTSVLPPPTDIKNDLTLIFEQYSSLNAIKKLTSSVKQSRVNKKRDKKGRKPYVIPDEVPNISTNIQKEDVHEASYRLVNEAEKIAEVKANLKKEINEEILNKINEKTSKLEENLGKTAWLKDEILGSIRTVKEELLQSVKEEIESKFEDKKHKDIDTRKDETTQELQKELLKKLDQKISQIEEYTKKHSEKMEQIKESLKEEIHKDLLSKMHEQIPQPKDIEQSIEKPEESEEDITSPETPFQEPIKINFEPLLNALLKEPKVKGTQILNEEGQTLAKKWNEGFAIHETDSLRNLQFFNIIDNEVVKTNQGNICHVLLESENETIVLAKLENKLLTVYTEGTEATYYGQILRAITNFEEKL